jgi:predicted DsbA family dithiol-disulfide isomerase
MKRNLMAAAVSAALAFNLAGCKKPEQQKPEEPKAAAKSANAVKVEFFVMSQCPYGVQVVNAVKDVVTGLGSEIDFQMNFIGNVTPDGQLTSMHGQTEVTGNMVQLCAAKHAPANYLDMVVCQNKNMKEVATNWKACATEAKLPVEKIESCLNGEEGKGLLKASFEAAKSRGARGSPTIFVDGKPYSGQRSTTHFFRAICAAHKGEPKPQACQNIPEPPKVNVTVLADKRCTDCRTEQLVNMIKFRVGNPVITELDYSDEAGKALYEKVGGGNLPLVLFDETLTADKDADQMFGRRLQPAGSDSKYRVFPTGGSWNPVCMSEGGCALETCKNTLACRQDAPNRLELFVMSQCPFGVKALNAMEEVLKNFNNKIDFQVHFIANGTAEAGFKALHGQPEVDENIRELCAIKLYGKNYKYMDYVLCRNKNIRDTNWQACTGSNGIDTKAMEKCFAGEGKKLHEEDIKVGNALGIGASPTWIANGKHKFSGIDAETIRRNLCEHNKDLKGCENKLTSGGAPVQGGCGQ